MTPITIEVGSNKQPFQVPKALLCFVSELIARRMKPNWDREEVDGNNNVKLDHIDDTTSFKDFLDWLYSGGQLKKTLTAHDLLDLYLLADGLVISDLQTAAFLAYKKITMSTRRDVADDTVDLVISCNGSVIEKIYAHPLPITDPLAAWTIEVWAIWWNSSGNDVEGSDDRLNGIEEMKSNLPHAFLLDLLVKKDIVRNYGWGRLKYDFLIEAEREGWFK